MLNFFALHIKLIPFFLFVFGTVQSQPNKHLPYQISDSILLGHVTALAHDSMKGRFSGSGEIALAANYIAGEMGKIGLAKVSGTDTGYLKTWILPDQKGQPGFHVLGAIPGTQNPEKLIIFSAHYDHIGVSSNQKAFAFGAVNKRVKGDSIYNGANDNATGVAAMLELARCFAALKPKYTLLFAAFSGEELGLLGSENFCSNLDPNFVVLNINLEMLGRPNNGSPYIIEEEGRYTYVDKLNKNLVAANMGYSKNFFISDPFPQQMLFTRSDNYSFHKIGIPSFTIMATSPYDKYYHSADDEVANIQLNQMTPIVQAIYWSLVPLVINGE